MSVTGVAALGAALAVAPANKPRLPSIAEFLRHPALEIVRHPDRVETFRTESLMGQSEADFPTATRVSTGRPPFVAFPEKAPVPPEVARQLSDLLLDRRTYSDMAVACLFQPAIGIRFHRGDRAVDVFICFGCADLMFQEVGAPNEFLGFLFDPREARLLELAQRARPDDTRLEKVRQMRENMAKEEYLEGEEENRGWAAMPPSLRPFRFDLWSDGWRKKVPRWRRALAAEIPDASSQVLALLAALGARERGDEARDHERMAEEILLTYPTPVLAAALGDGGLAAARAEGAVRLLANAELGERHPRLAGLLPPEVRGRLLEHAKHSDQDTRDRARQALGEAKP